MISASILTDRVHFYAPTVSRSAAGEQLITWSEAYTCRARVQFSKGSRNILSGEVWNPSSIVVTCRYSGSINTRQRILWNGNYYTVYSCNPDKTEMSLTIVADIVNDGQQQ